LFKAAVPAFLEPFHRLAVLRHVGCVDDDPHKVIAIENPTMPPVALNLLRLITHSAELIDDLQHSFGNPFGRHGAAIIELEWKQHLEAPPFAAQLRLGHHEDLSLCARWRTRADSP
jgi:hypothetical protein